MKIKSTTAFRAYANAHANRASEQAAERALHGEVGEQGRLDQPHGAHQERLEVRRLATAEDAERRRAQLESMNPGRCFAVVAF